MKNNIKIIICILCCQLGFSQIDSRIKLQGKVVNDSVKVENVVVFNLNSQKGKAILTDGDFQIYAKENDTLIFSSVLFKTKKIVLAQKQLEENPLIIHLEVYTNELKEVIINNKKLNPIQGNTQKIVDKKYSDDAKTSPRNSTMPTNVTENGVDFVRLYKDVMKLLKKKNPNKNDFDSEANFTEYAMQKIEYRFYTNTLKLKEDQIRLFLIFCENDPKAKLVLKNKTSFQLIDFLILKNNEFQEIIKSK